ncbi:hypothetical protein, partial [Ancylobacter oerskovii]|uniref:hypothetical protein n=1 Tax=Ancylobacter oerskovii TaxID=459519 RepID=UPI001BD06A7F
SSVSMIDGLYLNLEEDQGLRSVEDKSGNRYPFAVEGVCMKFPISRRVRPEERPGLPLQCQILCITTFRGQREFGTRLRERRGPGGVDQRQRQKCGQEGASA